MCSVARAAQLPVMKLKPGVKDLLRFASGFADEEYAPASAPQGSGGGVTESG